MTRSSIEQMLYMMHQAFEGDAGWGNWHSLLLNLESVDDADWLWTPEGGERSIFYLVQHLGMCKYVYDNHAFGDQSMRWDREGSIPSIEATTPRDEAVRWLREGHERLQGHLAALEDDAELLALRPGNWGTQHETRWLINTMIQHDLYHSGEINHIRALRQGNDE